MGLIFFAASNALALFAAMQLARALMPGARGLSRALLVAVGVPALVLPTLIVIGLLGWLTPLPTTLAMGAWALGLWSWARKVPEPAPQPTTTSPVPVPHAVAFGAALALVLLQVVSVIERQCFEGWKPQWDDISYHAPMAAHWIQAGRLILAPYNYHAYYPGTGELFAAWFMLPSHHDAFASLAGLFWMAAGGITVAALARRLGAGALAALVGVALYLGCRPFMHQAGSFAAVDLGGAVLLTAAIAIALGVSKADSTAEVRGRIVYVGCASGLAVGMKITFAPVAAAIYLWMLWERRSRLREALELAGLFGAAVLACGGYWYLRNYLLTGNPIFPAKLWIFEGPLDESALRPTALLFHLIRLEGAELTLAFWQLLDWPRELACLFIGGYALGALALLRPGYWNDPRDRRIALCVAAGLGALVIIVAGPFSGAANAETVHLQVRLRFFLLFTLLGLPLFAGFLGRTRNAQPALALAVVALAARSSELTLLEASLLLGAGGLAGVALAARARWPVLPAWLTTTVLCLVLPVVSAAAMEIKQPLNERIQKDSSPAWNSLKVVPDGARLTWFATFEAYKYYRGFGPELTRIPVAVGADGRPYRYLHEYWRTRLPTWWTVVPRARSIDRLVDNLRAQDIEYVLLIRQSEGRWPRQMKILSVDDRVRVLKQQKSFALLQIEKAKR